MTEPQHGTSSEDAVESGGLDDEGPDAEAAATDDPAEGQRGDAVADDDE